VLSDVPVGVYHLFWSMVSWLYGMYSMLKQGLG
jgi:hypothetical protein